MISNRGGYIVLETYHRAGAGRAGAADAGAADAKAAVTARHSSSEPGLIMPVA